MSKIKIGFFGWRGLVGKKIYNKVFKFKETFYYFTENKKFIDNKKYFYYKKINLIVTCKILIFCKDNLFVEKIYKKIKNIWKGYIIDASSYFRKNKKSLLILDPLNKKALINGIKNGIKIFCGANCTVSIMLMALGGLIKKNIIRKIYCSSYQSISGAGYNSTMELLKNSLLFLKKKSFKNKYLCRNLSFSLIPWIGNTSIIKGNSEEEIKGEFETNKIINNNIKIYSNCIRVNVLRCHSLSLYIKLGKNIKKKYLYNLLYKFNKDVIVIKNNFKYTKKYLDPYKISNTQKIYIGRIKKITNKEYSLFVIGDQLIWGAYKPIIRFLKILLKNLD
ncbi:Asd/ArgC dimerization domain-containing protein [Candidatus Vidania fulgoroideorum]